MTLAAGVRVGPYEVLGLLGVGGMGEVFRARDTQLNREVALKALPEAVALDPDRLARFRREAQVLAALNHPNIASIFGLEEANGQRAIVLELVEGPALAERIARGPLSLEEALPIAKQIAEALEAAHERGIVHRDLKPENIKLRRDGAVKVLDFGLAKVRDPALDSSFDSRTPVANAQTQVGTILGTVAYMSPEQARGSEVDTRSDIWSFGCVLYEMLAGIRAFRADGVADAFSSIMRDEPEWGALPADLPNRIRLLLTRCLDKDARRRLRDIGEARIALEDAIAGAPEAGTPSADRHSLRNQRLALGLGLVALVAIAVGAWVWRASRPEAPLVARLSIVPPTDAPLTGRSIAISPDGRRVVYASGNGSQLSVRAIDELVPQHIRNLGVPQQPFISPDGQWIGFFDGLNALKKVPITGGPATVIASLGGTAGRGASWSEDGTIVYATDDPATGLWRVSALGDQAPEMLTQREHGDHTWPHVLPGGKAVLFSDYSYPGEEATVTVLDLETRATKPLFPGSHARYVPSGHLVYAASGTLRTIAFDLARLAPVGVSMPVLDAIAAARDSDSGIDLSRNGTLAYVSGATDTLQNVSRELVWVDRQGNEERVGAPAEAYVIPRLSPDGTKIALDQRSRVGNGLLLWDIERKTRTRFSFGVEAYPVWAPDGQRLAFTSFDAKTGVGNLTWQRVDGTAQETLAEGTASRYATSFTPDGAALLFREETKSGLDIGMLSMGPAREAKPLVHTPSAELNPEVSPDGRWLAYESNESGRVEVYVRPFPDVEAAVWQISADGGTQPAWAKSGREIFYRARDGALIAVPVDGARGFATGAPTKVVEGRYFAAGPFRSYDVLADGRRFLLITRGDADAAAPSIVIVQNWFEELRRVASPL